MISTDPAAHVSENALPPILTIPMPAVHFDSTADPMQSSDSESMPPTPASQEFPDLLPSSGIQAGDVVSGPSRVGPLLAVEATTVDPVVDSAVPPPPTKPTRSPSLTAPSSSQTSGSSPSPPWPRSLSVTTGRPLDPDDREILHEGLLHAVEFETIVGFHVKSTMFDWVKRRSRSDVFRLLDMPRLDTLRITLTPDLEDEEAFGAIFKICGQTYARRIVVDSAQRNILPIRQFYRHLRCSVLILKFRNKHYSADIQAETHEDILASYWSKLAGYIHTDVEHLALVFIPMEPRQDQVWYLAHVKAAQNKPYFYPTPSPDVSKVWEEFKHPIDESAKLMSEANIQYEIVPDLSTLYVWAPYLGWKDMELADLDSPSTQWNYLGAKDEASIDLDQEPADTVEGLMVIIKPGVDSRPSLRALQDLHREPRDRWFWGSIVDVLEYSPIPER